MPATILLGTAGGSGLNGGGSLKFQNVLTNGTLVATSGFGPTLSITRATTSYTTDFEGLVKPILSGEARFWKLRRVENLAVNSGTLTAAAGWALTNTTTSGGVDDPMGGTGAWTLTATAGNGNINYDASLSSISRSCTFSIWLRRRTGSGQVKIQPNAATTAVDISGSLTSSWKRFAISSTATATTARLFVQIITNGDAVDIAFPLSEVTDGQSITAPSEYVSKGVLSSPYYGAGVDGVRYFNTANGNTVSSNVVTEATGASLTLTAAGLSVFGSSTERLLQNRDLTNAAWTKGATATVAKDQTGVDGVANSASSFTGGAVTATNTVTQAITLASSARYQYAYIKRLVGTGTIEMTTDNGTTWVDVTSQISASWALVTIPVQTVTNPTAGLRITTLNDKIAVDFISNRSEAGAPVVATAGSQVTVNADVDGATLNGILTGVLFVKAISQAGSPAAQAYAASLSDGTNNNTVELSRDTSNNPKADVIVGGASQASIDAGTWANATASKVAARFATNDFAAAIDGGAEVTDVSGTVPTTTTVRVGQRGDSTGFWNGVIQEVRVYAAPQNTTTLTQ